MKHIILTLFLSFGYTSSFAFTDTLSPETSSDDSLTLIMFLLDDCPICLDYTLTIKELHAAYGDRISFVGYFPNFSSKPEKIDSFKRTFGIKFPLYSDYYKTQAKKWNAEVTPEVILYNNSQDKIIYQGRIDNKFVRLGKRRSIVTESDLKKAIINTLENRPIENAFMPPIGCFINYADNIRIKN